MLNFPGCNTVTLRQPAQSTAEAGGTAAAAAQGWSGALRERQESIAGASQCTKRAQGSWNRMAPAIHPAAVTTQDISQCSEAEETSVTITLSNKR